MVSLPPVPTPDVPPPARLASLDALRGLAILAIIGFDGAVAAFAEMAQSGPVLFRVVCGVFAQQFSHAEWDGLNLYDFAFPLFIFITVPALPSPCRARWPQSRGVRSIYASSGAPC